MKKRLSLLLLLLAILFAAGIFRLSDFARASSSTAPSSQEIATNQLPMTPTNYCLSCHTADDPYLSDPTAWQGGIARAMVNPCPAAIRLQEETYFTERMLLAIDRGKTGLNSSAAAKVDTRQAVANDMYSRLLDAPVTSLDAFVSEAQSLRYRMGKTQTLINGLVDAAKKQRSLIFGVLVSVILLISLGWGIYNIRKINPSALQSRSTSFYMMGAVFLLFVMGLFALPLFRPLEQETVTNTIEEQEVAATLDTASRAATAAGRAAARGWMFAKIGAAWQPLAEIRSQEVLETARRAAFEANLNTLALWGDAANAREAAASSQANFEKAGLIASELNAARSRAWALGLIGAEWTAVDPAQSDEIFSDAFLTALSGQGIYRDLDLRRIAAAWAKTNPERALTVIMEINDPALRAWGLRDIAALTGEKDLLIEAVSAARQISDPVQRARKLSKIAAASQAPELFTEALAALDGQSGAPLAYALSDLAADSGDAELVEQIDPTYPEARTLALLKLGLYPAAWEAASEIQDPYEQGRAQGAIISGWAREDGKQAAGAAGKILVPVLRERAMRDVIRTTGDASLVEKLSIAYYRVQALTALGQYQAAWEQAELLKDPYPLVDLGVAWAATDPEAAGQTLSELSQEADKAVVLRELAAVTNDQDLFERALGMAMAARVRNNALAPAQASLELALRFIASAPEKALAALEQALLITEKIAIQ